MRRADCPVLALLCADVRDFSGMEAVVWLVSLALVAILWTSGARLFARSALTLRRKVIWTLFLLAAGTCVGLLLPFRAIEHRFLIVLVLLPVLALIDIKLARSNRTFFFWLRACSFEVCTVFGFAALIRVVLDGR